MGRPPRVPRALKRAELVHALEQVEQALRLLAADLRLPGWLRYRLLLIAAFAADIGRRSRPPRAD